MAVATEEATKKKGGSRPQSPAQRALSQFQKVENEIKSLVELVPAEAKGALTSVNDGLDAAFHEIMKAIRAERRA
jgi:hypothetical protein